MAKTTTSQSFTSSASAYKSLTDATLIGDFAGIKKAVDGLTAAQVAKLKPADADSAISAMIEHARHEKQSQEQDAADIAGAFKKIGQKLDSSTIDLMLSSAAASPTNFPVIKAIAGNLTPLQAKGLDSAGLGNVFGTIAMGGYGASLVGNEESTAKDLGELIRKMGGAADGAAMSTALQDAAGDLYCNVPAVKAIADNLTPDQLRGLDPSIVGYVAQSMVRTTEPGREEERAADIAAVLKKIGPRGDAKSMQDAMLWAGSDLQPNMPAMKAITAALTPDQVKNLDPQLTGELVAGLIKSADSRRLGERAKDVAEILDKVGPALDGAAMSHVLSYASSTVSPNVPAIKAVAAAINPDQLNDLDPSVAAFVINDMVVTAKPGRLDERAADIATVMKKIGSRIDPTVLKDTLSRAENPAIAKAITDNVTPEQATTLGIKPAAESKFGAAPVSPPVAADEGKKVKAASRSTLAAKP